MCQGREHWWDLANKAPKRIQIKKHRNTDIHVLLHQREIWHLILGKKCTRTYMNRVRRGISGSERQILTAEQAKLHKVRHA